MLKPKFKKQLPISEKDLDVQSKLFKEMYKEVKSAYVWSILEKIAEEEGVKRKKVPRIYRTAALDLIRLSGSVKSITEKNVKKWLANKRKNKIPGFCKDDFSRDIAESTYTTRLWGKDRKLKIPKKKAQVSPIFMNKKDFEKKYKNHSYVRFFFKHSKVPVSTRLYEKIHVFEELQKQGSLKEVESEWIYVKERKLPKEVFKNLDDDPNNLSYRVALARTKHIGMRYVNELLLDKGKRLFNLFKWKLEDPYALAILVESEEEADELVKEIDQHLSYMEVQKVLEKHIIDLPVKATGRNRAKA